MVYTPHKYAINCGISDELKAVVACYNKTVLNCKHYGILVFYFDLQEPRLKLWKYFSGWSSFISFKTWFHVKI